MELKAKFSSHQWLSCCDIFPLCPSLEQGRELIIYLLLPLIQIYKLEPLNKLP